MRFFMRVHLKHMQTRQDPPSPDFDYLEVPYDHFSVIWVPSVSMRNLLKTFNPIQKDLRKWHFLSTHYRGKL